MESTTSDYIGTTIRVHSFMLLMFLFHPFPYQVRQQYVIMQLSRVKYVQDPVFLQQDKVQEPKPAGIRAATSPILSPKPETLNLPNLEP